MPQIRYVRMGRRPVNPLMQIAGVVVGLVVLGIAVIVGGFVLAALIGLGLIAWFVILLRVWWLTRSGRRESVYADRQGRQGGEVVEAEYQVIEATPRDDGKQPAGPRKSL